MWELSKYSNKCALIDDSLFEISYEQLNQEAKELYSVIGRRCLAFSLCTNSIGSILGYVSFVNNGVVPVLLNAHLDDELLIELLDKYKPVYLWMPLRDVSRFPGTVVKYEKYEYALVRTKFSDEYKLYPDLCLLLSTSGSTGSPKFVRQSYDNVKSNAEAIASYLEINEFEKPITTLPMNYTYGLSIINSHLAKGATILVTEKGIMQKEFWDFFKSQRASSFGGVPYTYEMLNRLRFYRMELPDLKYMTQAGGKLTPELHKRFAEYAEETGKKFFVMYGQCEATARMGYLPADKSLEKCGSMGIAIPGGRFSLIDDSGNEVTVANEPGELVYTGPNVTLGYAESGMDLSKGDEREGILYTGDVAKFDQDGYYYIIGRLKRFLKIYGNRVNLDEVDSMIKGHFNNIECASAGIDDHMYIFLTDKEYEKEIKQYVVMKTGLNAIAFKTIVLDAIPKNESGKILYNELSKYF